MRIPDLLVMSSVLYRSATTAAKLHTGIIIFWTVLPVLVLSPPTSNFMTFHWKNIFFAATISSKKIWKEISVFGEVDFLFFSALLCYSFQSERFCKKLPVGIREKKMQDEGVRSSKGLWISACVRDRVSACVCVCEREWVRVCVWEEREYLCFRERKREPSDQQHLGTFEIFC